jgi:hypothetical protein
LFYPCSQLNRRSNSEQLRLLQRISINTNGNSARPCGDQFGQRSLTQIKCKKMLNTRNPFVCNYIFVEIIVSVSFHDLGHNLQGGYWSTRVYIQQSFTIMNKNTSSSSFVNFHCDGNWIYPDTYVTLF